MIEYNLIGGLVHGNFWGGGKGAYPCEKKKGFETKEELIDWTNKELKSGGLDSGMGFNGLNGAVLIIQKVEKVDLKGKIFSNEEIEYCTIGNLTEEQIYFLYDNLQ